MNKTYTPSLMYLVGALLVVTVLGACGARESPAQSVSETPTVTAPHTSQTPTPPPTETPIPQATLPVFDVALSPGYRESVIAGQSVTFTHTVTNTGAEKARVALTARVEQPWTVFFEPKILELDAAQTGQVSVRLSVPLDVLSGTVRQITLMASVVDDKKVQTSLIDVVTAREDPDIAALEAERPLAKLGADFGFVVTNPDVIAQDFPLVKAMGVDWVRLFLPWYEIETAPKTYTWTAYDPVFNQLRALDLRAMVVVYGAPEWAAEHSCGPISDTLMLEEFLDVLVPRYADVAGAWEFGNEPDGRTPHETYGAVIGCWGLQPDVYAEQLAVFYEHVKALDPHAWVFFGGLAYDGWHHFERTFFERALYYGAGEFFDGASVHYYPINREFPTMGSKINELQEAMRIHDVHDKLIWITETAMWVNDHPAVPGSPEIHRNFIVRGFAQGFGAGADNIIWFTVAEEPWRQDLHRWLINQDHEPANGYATFQHLATELDGLRCVGPYTGVPAGVEAYQFESDTRLLYIVWSAAGTRVVNLPVETEVWLTDRDGESTITLTPDEGVVTFEVGIAPVFVEVLR